MSKAPLTPREAEMFALLRQLTHQSVCINAMQHAGQSVPAEAWSDLYQLTNSCKVFIQQVKDARQA